MDAIRKKTPSRYQLYLICIIALVILMIYTGFTVLPNKNRPSSKIAFKPCLKDAFKDILLVIFYNYPFYDSIPHLVALYKPAFYNYPFYDSIPHLVALYKPAFPNLLFCGPPGNIAQPDIPTVDKIKDFLGYECLGRAIREHPGYAGYFFISDDVILKYWKFLDFDRDKFWESYHTTTSPASGPASSDWYWWNAQYGLSNCLRALEDVAKMTLAEKKLNGTQLLDTLLKNGNGKLLCFGGRWDILYVPQRHATAFSILSETFYKQQVFLEIAVPTIYRLLERNQNIARLPGYFIPGNVGDPPVTDSRFFWYFYFLRKEYYFVHPFKLHRGGIDSKFSSVMMKHIFINKIKALTNCTPTLL